MINLSGSVRKMLSLVLSVSMLIAGIGLSDRKASAAKKAGVKLNKTNLSLTVGKNATLKVKKTKVKNVKVSWKSSKKAVASVNKKGKVKARKKGIAVITAKVKYRLKGSNKKKTKFLICTVRVKTGGNTGPGNNKKNKNSNNNRISIEPIEGTRGVSDNEAYSRLFDQSALTKWCITDFSGSYAIWKLSKSVQATGYSIVTGNDNSKYGGRNPNSWKLYGCNSNSVPSANNDKWQLIDSVSNDTVLQDVNEQRYNYTLSKPAPAFQYYMLVITKTKSSSTMQISEFNINYKGSNYDYLSKSDYRFAGDSVVLGNINFTYNVKVGEYITLYSTMSPISSLYAYTWVVDTNPSVVYLDRSGPTCAFYGIKPGKAKITSSMSESVLNGFNYDSSTRYESFYINVVE